MKQIILIAALFSAIWVKAQDSKNYHLTKSFKINSAGGWDYIALDRVNNRIYASHSSQVNILDKISGDSLGVITNTTGVHGIAINHDLNKGYTSNGKLNNLTVFNLSNYAVLGHIKTGLDPDAILYDTFTKLLIVCNGDSNDLNLIDPVTEKIIATIAVGGVPETAVSDGKHIYVNIEDKNEIVVIDLSSKSVIHHWTLPGGDEPTGLAIDLKTRRLFSACKNGLLFVVNADNGKIVSKLNIDKGCDGVAFDPKVKYIFTSNGASGTLSIIEEKSSEEFKPIQKVATKIGAKTLTLDPGSHSVYILAAELNQQVKDERGRPKMIPGTFQVLVVEK